MDGEKVRYGVRVLWTVRGELREMDWRPKVADWMDGQDRVLVVLAVATGDKGLAWQHVTSKLLRCTSLDDLSAAADQEREIAAEAGTVIYGAVAHVITPDDLAWARFD